MKLYDVEKKKWLGDSKFGLDDMRHSVSAMNMYEFGI